MKKRILAVVLTLLMLLPVVPMSVSAAGDGFIVSGGEIDKDYTYSGGVLTVLSSTAITVKNKDSSAATSDCIVVKKDISANITLAGVNISTDSAPAFMIEDDSTGDVTVTLAANSVNTLTSTGADFAGLQKNGGTDTGTLTITGTGKLTATGGICGAGIGGSNSGSGSNITISGGVVTATGGQQGGASIGGGKYGTGSNITISGGVVKASNLGLGAGIGGGYNGSGSNITITGGEVTATSDDYGAGIGGGGERGSGSNITVTGGVVKATGGYKGAGIGGGYNGSGSNITISGGTVTAQGGTRGAGIGGGSSGDGSNITISGGSVHAVKGGNAPNDIGGGTDGNDAVTPTNGTSEVYLLTIANPNKQGIIIDNKIYSPFNHSAIDGDTNLYAYLTGEPHDVVIGDTLYKYTYSNGTFTPDGGTKITQEANPQFDIKVTKTNTAAVFGKDYYYADGTLSIVSDEDVTVSNKADVATASHGILIPKDIDISVTLNGVNISIGSAPAFKIDDDSTGDVTVTLAANSVNTLISTGNYYAGLQKNGNGTGIGKLTITGTGKLTAQGGNFGAGIGGGNGKSGSNITISGGEVTATSKLGGAGIGGGDYASGSNITISGGVVTANGGAQAAGIGGGRYASGSYITISGGVVKATSNLYGAGIGGGYYGSGSNITISGGTVTATSNLYGAGIGGGRSGSGSNITISGGSVHAIKGKDAPNDIGGGLDGNGAVTPKNAEKHDVYLMTIPNPSNAKVYIDNTEYIPSNHSAIDEENNTNLYAYVTGTHHTVTVGTETSCYHFVNNAFVKCDYGNSWANDANGHWHACSDENCDIQHDFAEHTFYQEAAAEQFKTGVAATCQHGTQYYKSCVCGAKGTETFYGTDVDSSNHVGTLGNWVITDSEHWKEYSGCGCKANKGTHTDISPKDHKCDDCGKVISVCEDKNLDHVCDYADCKKVMSEHELNDHPYFKADCTHNGMIAHYSCVYCGKLFADENAENEITDSDIVIPATGHSYENGECVNCGARDPEISKCKAFFLDIFKLIVRIIKDFPVWIKTLPEAFIGLFG